MGEMQIEDVYLIFVNLYVRVQIQVKTDILNVILNKIKLYILQKFDQKTELIRYYKMTREYW